MVERNVQFEARRAQGIFKTCSQGYVDILVLDGEFRPVMKFRGYWDVASANRELLHLGVQVCSFRDEEMKRKVIKNGFGDPYNQYFSVVCERKKNGWLGRDGILNQAVADLLWDMRSLLSIVFGAEYRREEEERLEGSDDSMDSYLQQNWSEILEKNGWKVIKI